MSNIKRNGVLVRPGKYKFYGNEEIRTIGELKKAIERQKDGIMLTYGHATDDTPIPGANQFVGTAYPYWDSSEKAVLANYDFHEEYWDTIPENIRKKIVNDEKVPISIGYRVDRVDNESKQQGILFTHVALVPEGEEPIASDVGVNVRVESQAQQMLEHDLPPNYRLESGEIPEVKKTEPAVEAIKMPEYATKADLQALMAKFDAFVESQKPTGQKPEAKAEPEQAKPTQEEQKPVPEVQIPVGERKTRGPNIVGGVISVHTS